MQKRIDGLQAKHVYQSKYSERKLPKLPGEKKKIETGAVIRVPLFIRVGDTIKIDTRTHEYVERVERLDN